MTSRTRILRAHCFGVLKKCLAWTSMLTILVSVGLVAAPMAEAAQLTSRSATMSTSVPSSTSDNVTFSFTFSSGYTVKGIDFQVCDSPIQTVTCSAPSGASFASASATLGTTSGGCASFAFSSQSATDYKITFGSGNAVTSSSTCSATINGFTNPSTNNTEFYFRVITFTDTGFSSPSANGQDFGAMAVSTGTTMNISSLIQESLVFQVGTSGTCSGGLSGTTAYIGGSSTAVLSSTAANIGTSLMCVTTNGTGGYVLQYVSDSAHGAGGAFTNYSGATHDFGDNSSGATFASGTSGGSDFFGINIRGNTGASGDVAGGADPSGGVSPTIPAPYGTPDAFGFAHASATQLASENTGPTATTTYTVSYEAQASPTTPSGQYQVNLNYIATSTF
jgi:hypothetical protein